jgi:hypothetical protein
MRIIVRIFFITITLAAANYWAYNALAATN